MATLLPLSVLLVCVVYLTTGILASPRVTESDEVISDDLVQLIQDQLESAPQFGTRRTVEGSVNIDDESSNRIHAVHPVRPHHVHKSRAGHGRRFLYSGGLGKTYGRLGSSYGYQGSNSGYYGNSYGYQGNSNGYYGDNYGYSSLDYPRIRSDYGYTRYVDRYGYARPRYGVDYSSYSVGDYPSYYYSQYL